VETPSEIVPAWFTDWTFRDRYKETVMVIFWNEKYYLHTYSLQFSPRSAIRGQRHLMLNKSLLAELSGWGGPATLGCQEYLSFYL
jgi:hypothetical protein